MLSQKGKPLLNYNGYKYYKHRKYDKVARWVCSTHHKKGCRAVITTLDNTIHSVKYEHNHSRPNHGSSKASFEFLSM